MKYDLNRVEPTAILALIMSVLILTLGSLTGCNSGTTTEAPKRVEKPKGKNVIYSGQDEGCVFAYDAFFCPKKYDPTNLASAEPAPYDSNATYIYLDDNQYAKIKEKLKDIDLEKGAK